MIKISYAQNYEDIMLLRALSDVTHGRYIDIGAQDPVRDSVSLAFYERGWRGVNVEPTPHYADALRVHRPEDQIIQAFVDKERAPKTLYEIPGTGLSTGIEDISALHTQNGFTPQEHQVACISLESILESFGGQDIHWLKIDVEGMERNVLESWGASTALPWIVLLESVFPCTPQRVDHEWNALLFARGYEDVYFDGINNFYLAPHQLHRKAAFATPPNIFDDFVVSRTHFCARLLDQDLTQAGR